MTIKKLWKRICCLFHDNRTRLCNGESLEDGVKFVNEHYEEVYTGDTSHVQLWITLASLCAVVAVAVLDVRRRYYV